MCIGEIMKRLARLFRYKCPECGGVLCYETYDADCDREVYKCSKCDETWF